MSRKQATFGQLVDYFEDGRQDAKYNIYHNIYSTNAENIKVEFNKNATFLNQRKNGVYMYHEVLSITKTDKLTREQQKEILKDIGLEYIQNRANNNLVFAVLHDDKADNLHYHFMISSNELESPKRLRLSKEKFSQFKKDLELRVLNKYPELEQKKLINKEPGAEKETGEKLSNKGVELKRRTGKTSQKDNVKDRLKTVFSASKTKADFFNELEKENLSIYVNGNTIGILDKATERKHRLKTLGMLDEFNAISQVIEESETKKEDVKEKQNEPKTNEFSKERIDTRAYRDQKQQVDEKQVDEQEPTQETQPEKETFKERVDTRAYRDQQKHYTDSKPVDEKEKPKENKPYYDTKAEQKPKTEYHKTSEPFKKPYHRTDEKAKQEPSREANKERETKPVKDDYQPKTRRYSDRDSDRSKTQDSYKNTDTKTNSDRFKNSQEKWHEGYRKPKPDRYEAPKSENTYKPKNESDLNQAKGEYKPRSEKNHEDRTHKNHWQKGKERSDYKNKVPKTEMELEIERRKAQLKKERDRDQEPDYSKDFSKGK
jgi:hypothetical protein